MTLEQGLLAGGKIVPGTDWVLRDTSAWYTRGDDDVYLRARPIDLITFHWTAGPRRSGSLAAQKTYAAMQARKNEAGKDMSVSAQFVISDDGLLFQLADLDLCCVHADRQFNLRGVGVEYAFPGTVKQADMVKQTSSPSELRRVAGGMVDCILPDPRALAAGVRLAELLASGTLPARFGRIPRVAYTQRNRLHAAEMLTCKGAVEHFHAASTTKVDAAGFFVDALAAAGWPAA